jgi:hypothetical protein
MTIKVGNTIVKGRLARYEERLIYDRAGRLLYTLVTVRFVDSEATEEDDQDPGESEEKEP